MSTGTITLKHDTDPEIAEASVFTLSMVRDRLVVNLHGFPDVTLEAITSRLPGGWKVESSTASRVVIAKPAPTSSARINVTVFSSNIMGTPVMPRGNVTSDIDKVLAHFKGGVGAFQEIGSNKGSKFYKAILRQRAIAHGYGVTALTSENPIVWDKAKYRKIKAGVVFLTPGHGGIFSNPHRTFSWALLEDRKTGRRFYVVGTHWANGAWNGQYSGASMRLRRAFWKKQFAGEDKWLEQLAATERLPILMVGDYNSHGRTMPKFLSGEVAVAGGSSSDHVSFWAPGAHKVLARGLRLLGLHTDHPTIAGTVQI